MSYFNLSDVKENTPLGDHWARFIRKKLRVIFGASEATPDLQRMLEMPPAYKDPDTSDRPQERTGNLPQERMETDEFQYKCCTPNGIKETMYDCGSGDLC